MSSFVHSPTRTFTAGGALAQYRRVKLSTGKLAYAGASDSDIGTLETAAFADGDTRAVRLRNAEGTAQMVASEAISLGATVYAAADGKVAASGSIVVGQALVAAGANNDVIEVLRHSDPADPFTTQTVTADDSESALNQILPGVNSVVVGGVTNNANDFVVLPALADVENGYTITVIGSASSNFEVRTPADSDEEINSENCDGTKEYLFTDTQIHEFVKINNTIGWMGHGYSAIGAVVTAVVPD